MFRKVLSIIIVTAVLFGGLCQRVLAEESKGSGAEEKVSKEVKELIDKAEGGEVKAQAAPVSYTHLTLPTTPYV